MIHKKHAIVICDDQPALRKVLLEAVLAYSEDIDIFEAESGVEVENILSNISFDAVFLDVDMPRQDGFTTLSNLKERGLVDDTVVVMCTGRSQQEDLIKGWQLGADHYVTKPFDFGELMTILQAIFEADQGSQIAA